MAASKPAGWATFQGLRVARFEYTIRGDLAPDDGEVEFESETVDTDTLALDKIPLIPYDRNAFGIKFVNPVHIAVFAGLGGTGGTIARPSGPAPADLFKAKDFKGLRTFGSLRFSSRETGAGSKPIAISEVYLHRDTAQDLRKQGSDGGRTTKLRLTDARQFWTDLGDCFGFINVVQSVGIQKAFNPLTIRPDGKPYALSTVLDWLFFHLPGPPIVRGIEKACAGLAEPTNVIREHEPPYPEIARLMQQYGLALARELDGTYTLWRRQKRPILAIAGAPVVTPQRSLEVRYPPAAVRIRGAHIRRNLLRTALPVSRDLDGRIYPLHQVIARYSDREYALSQIPGDGERQFEALPNEDIRKIAREDWGRLFQISTAVGYDGSGPILDVPIFDPVVASKAGAIERRAVSTGGGAQFEIRAAPETSILADGSGTQDVHTIPPVVIGHSYGQRLLDTTEEPTLTPSEIFRAASRDRKREILKEFFNIESGKLLRRTFGNSLRAHMEIIFTEYGELLEKKTKEFERLQIELQDAKKTFSQIIFDGTRWRALEIGQLSLAALEVLTLRDRLEALAFAADEKRRERDAIRAELKRVEIIIDKIKNRQDMTPEERFWINFGEIEFSPDAYTLTRETGIIRMHAPVGLVSPPLVLNREHLKLVTLPTLQVFYAIEHRTLTPADRYTMLLIVEENGNIKEERTRGRWPEPSKIAQGQEFPVRGSSLPVVPLPREEILLYLDSRGEEFNGKLCDEAARERGQEYLGSFVKQIEGATFYYEGWHAPDTMEGVDSATWTLSGGKPVTSVAHSNRFHTSSAQAESPAKAADARTVSVYAARGGSRDGIRVGP